MVVSLKKTAYRVIKASAGEGMRELSFGAVEVFAFLVYKRCGMC